MRCSLTSYRVLRIFDLLRSVSQTLEVSRICSLGNGVLHSLPEQTLYKSCKSELVLHARDMIVIKLRNYRVPDKVQLRKNGRRWFWMFETCSCDDPKRPKCNKITATPMHIQVFHIFQGSHKKFCSDIKHVLRILSILIQNWLNISFTHIFKYLHSS